MCKKITGNLRSKLNAVVFILVIIIAAALGLTSFRMVDELPATSPPDTFSAERAFSHIEVISKHPHPIGGDTISSVRTYIKEEIIKLGLAPVTQNTTVPDYFYLNKGNPVDIQNIYTVIPGKDPTGSIILAGHYDTVPVSPGANDNSSAVATLIETTRALLASPQQDNDVIILFTDAEEPGQFRYGARYFVEHFNTIEDVFVVLNFEALGRTGPSIMFETAPGNRWLIEALAKNAPTPVAFSFMSDLYRSIAAGGTDFVAFEEKGINGLNFAYSFERTGYHTALDNIDSVDLRSLQHHGEYALNLTRYFGNYIVADHPENNTPDSVYHSLFGRFILRYPTSWVLPITALCTLVLVLLLFVAFKKKKITMRQILISFFFSFGELLSITIVTTLLWWGIDELNMAIGFVVDPGLKSHVFFIGFLLLTMAIMMTARLYLKNRLSSFAANAGSAFVFLVIAILAAIFVPGFNIIFVWPLLLSCIPLFLMINDKSMSSITWSHKGLLLSGTLISVILLTVPIYLLFQGIGTASPGFSGSPSFPIIGLSIIFWAFLLWILLPVSEFFMNWKNRKIIAGLSILALLLIIIGFILPGIAIGDFGLF